MKKYKVTVEKMQKVNGTVEIEADNVDEAMALIEQQISCGKIRTTDCSWEEEYPDYVDNSFQATGDIESIDGDDLILEVH